MSVYYTKRLSKVNSKISYQNKIVTQWKALSFRFNSIVNYKYQINTSWFYKD